MFAQLTLYNWPFYKKQNSIFPLTAVFIKQMFLTQVKSLCQFPGSAKQIVYAHRNSYPARPEGLVNKGNSQNLDGVRVFESWYHIIKYPWYNIILNKKTNKLITVKF